MSPRTKNPQFDQDHWKRLLNAWPRLHPCQCKALVIHGYWLIIPRLKPPVAFSVRAMFAIFALLLFLPHHPMSIPIAIGGGLSFALITH